MITNAGVTDSSAIDAQLNAPERQQMHQLIDSGATLPEALENVLVETQARIDRGEIPDEIAESSHPTSVC
jgi:enhancing lycopene biosynthesis protein 2